MVQGCGTSRRKTGVYGVAALDISLDQLTAYFSAEKLGETGYQAILKFCKAFSMEYQKFIIPKR